MHNSFRHNIKRARMQFLHSMESAGIHPQAARWFANHHTAAELYSIRRKSVHGGLPAVSS